MQGQAQCHNVGIELAEFQGRSVFGERVQVHGKKIHGEFTVEIMKLVFIFAKRLIKMRLVNPIEVVEVVRTLGVYAFVDDEMFAVLFVNEGMGAVRAAQDVLFGETVILG